jgi:D-lactate dehydrogenase
MINMKNVRLIKKGAYLINTARGGLIETKALIYGLDTGIIAGAALDVLEGEDDLREERLHRGKLTREEKRILKGNHMLLKDKDVFVTPHSAFYTREALVRILDRTVENVVSGGKNCV